MGPVQKRILCVDNNASSNLAVYLLERAGYEVISASSIADAIDLSRQVHFDLHLLNHKLVGSEIDSCDRLQRFADRTPILFYSTVSYPYQQIQEIHCRSHGGHSLKPVNVWDVVNHVYRLQRKASSSVDQARGEVRTAKRAIAR